MSLDEMALELVDELSYSEKLEVVYFLQSLVEHKTDKLNQDEE